MDDHRAGNAEFGRDIEQELVVHPSERYDAGIQS